MASVVGTFLLLLMICCLAGYPALRYLGKGLPADQQVVALPLLGSAILALLLQWTHVAAPLSRMTVLGVLIPALVAASLVVFHTLRNRKLTRPGSASILTIAIAIVCVLIPFFKLGRPTSFAIINNDAFFYAAADFLVQHTRYTDTSPPSILARSAARIRRYGIDYLSTVVQATTGLRSWETVQLTGAFGLLLSMAAAYLLTRGLGGNRQAAAIAGIVVGMSHWTFRLYMEAVLAYLFGLAYLIACVWACTLKRIENLPFRNRIAVAGLMLCGLTVFYFDLLPLFLVIAVSGLAAGAICRQKFAFPATAVAALVIVPLPVLHQAISHFLRLSATTGPGKHFNLADVPRTILHFTGTMDVYDYIYWPGSITPIHVAGATAVVILAGMAFSACARPGWPSCLRLPLSPQCWCCACIWRTRAGTTTLTEPCVSRLRLRFLCLAPRWPK